MCRKAALQSFLSLAFLVLYFIGSAQTIRFNGRVLNQKNEPVSGASINISGTDRPVAADVEGRFILNLQPGKKYTLTVTAVGYQPKEVADVEVGAGLENFITIVMEVAAKEVGEVVIRSTARKENTSGLLNFQKNNVSLSSGIAADFIRRTPDRNTSDVLKRVSGTSIQDNKFVIVRGLSDRYNQAYLNNAMMPSSEPDKKAFSFDVIPSIMIDNIITNKTATPDLTGEFAGGLVQVNTRDVPVRNVLQVGVSFGYNTQTTFREFVTQRRSATDWFGFDDGKRSLPGIPNTVNYRALPINQKVEASKLFPDDVFLEQRTTAMPISTFNLAWANTKNLKNNARFGTIIALYHRQSQIAFADVERNRFENPASRPPIFTGFEVQNRYTVTAGAMANFTYLHKNTKISFKNLVNQLYDDSYVNRLVNNTGRFQEVSLRSSFLNQRLLYSSQLEFDQKLTRSGARLNLNGSFAYNNKMQPDFRTAQYVRSTLSSGSVFQLDDDDSRRFFSTLYDYSAGVNGFVTVPFMLFGEKQTFKAGGSTLVRFRQFNARNFVYRPTTTQTDLSKPYTEMFLRSNLTMNDGLYLDEQTQNTDFYFGVSALNGGFVMFDNKLGEKFRAIWGLRAELFQQVLSTRDLSLKRIIVNTEKWDFLPSLNLTYSLKAQQQLRFAVARTVARPEFREIAPFQFFDYEAIWGISGTPELRRTSIMNFDLRYEYYPKSGEMLSVGLLAKRFNDPIELRMDPGSNSDRWLFKYTNADNALLYGGEIEVRKGLDFVSEKLKQFTFLGNFTYLFSQVGLTTEQAGGVTTTQNRPLFGQSPYLINAGLQYATADGIWNATLLYNRIGPRLDLVGDPLGAGFFDIYENPRNLLDLQVAKRILKGNGELKFTVSDIFNNRFVFYDNPTADRRLNKAAGDRINYAYRPGTTYTIGFTYDFKLGK
ncbi:MAG: carboxypeptidase regulatory-like domain-containing protein [Lacibacter sp.]